jgi:hypothetical protein
MQRNICTPRRRSSPASRASDDRTNSRPASLGGGQGARPGDHRGYGSSRNISEIVKRKAKAQAAKANHVKKSKADAPEEKAPPEKHPGDVIFAELKSETSPNFRRTWAEAPTKVQRQYLREVLKWEGGKPISTDD